MTYRRFPKLGLVVDCRSHLILAAVAGRGPSPDHPHLIEAVLAARERRAIETLLADAGYDAEWVHRFVRDELDIRSIIPPQIGRPTAKPPTGRYRLAMQRYFRRPKRRRRYGQRWQAETVFSMIKRRLGASVNARSDRRQRRAMLLKAIVHNILILFDGELFYRAGLSQFSSKHIASLGVLAALRFNSRSAAQSTDEARAGRTCSRSRRTASPPARLSRAAG
jgi:transposase